MKENCYHIFVYGTLRDSSVNHKAHFLKVNSEFIGKGTIQARLYKVSWYPAIVLSDKAQDRVHGDLFKIPIDKCEFVLHEIDGYEGIYHSNEESDEYERVVTEVKLENGELTEAWVYNYKAAVEEENRIDSGDYLKFLQEN